MKEVVNEYISKNGKRIQLKESDDRYSLGVISPYDLTEYPYAVRLKNKNVWNSIFSTPKGIIFIIQ